MGVLALETVIGVVALETVVDVVALETVAGVVAPLIVVVAAVVVPTYIREWIED